MNLKRYIDAAVRREVRRIFRDNAALEVLKSLNILGKFCRKYDLEYIVDEVDKARRGLQTNDDRLFEQAHSAIWRAPSYVRLPYGKSDEFKKLVWNFLNNTSKFKKDL
jgi:hypothetical protein